MANADDGAGDGVLQVPIDELISASGGFDAIASELGQHAIGVLDLDLDFNAGESLELAGALGHFATAWTEGLGVLVQRQRARASALYGFVSNMLEVDHGIDANTAYVALVEARGLDLR